MTLSRRIALALLTFIPALDPPLAGAVAPAREVVAIVTPAASGRQLVRVSLALPNGLLAEGRTLVATAGRKRIMPGVRVLTWHPAAPGQPKFARRALVTFPYEFAGTAPVKFTFKARNAGPTKPKPFPVEVIVSSEEITLAYRDGPTIQARLTAPPRTTNPTPRAELLEANAFFRWQRFHFEDAQWPRVIEVRSDALGSVAVVAHLQRNLPGDGRAPDFGWLIQTRSPGSRLESNGHLQSLSHSVAVHSFTNGAPAGLSFENGRLRLNHPAAPLKRRGRIEAWTDNTVALTYRYWRCTADEKVPMQQAAWHRAEFGIAPTERAPLTSTLEEAHAVEFDWRPWDELYATGPPLNLRAELELAALLRYHHDAIVRSMAVGDDWGNVTSYSDSSETGAVFGMNRLNHCPAIFEEAWRSGDRRLREVALLWCDDFFDQSIWWGPGATGGTRYNNLRAMNRTPPDDDQSYMWRSNSSVNFCTKGYDSFLLAYEETGDPRMWEALEVQTRYASEHVHADRGECRNIGDVRDFIRLHRFTGQTNYLAEALRLFRELRTKLSTGELFDQGGKPLAADPPFIEEDNAGLRVGYAKPYIIGYALAGLPELARVVEEPPSTGSKLAREHRRANLRGGPVQVAFPLTPALSRRERGQRQTGSEESKRPGHQEPLPDVLPLPAGEGRGEGEDRLQMTSALKPVAARTKSQSSPPDPKLRNVIQAVADFLAQSQDPLGGWRYPHPRSSYMILSQGLEHAWQIVQADRFLGAQEKHLDAIERVLRQRLHGWRKTGKVFAGLTGWEVATGRVKDRAELYALYAKPADRDFTRDYGEGRAEFGSSPPEGLVYFPEVLAFYLKHRPASRLLAPPRDDEPLGQVLKRVP
ncbi:MAG: hypothetical protein HYY24_23960 [Verrucomicrobia bacterium]|nr:hypothetical protein [Verrucomicrobiota bacterium]